MDSLEAMLPLLSASPLPCMPTSQLCSRLLYLLYIIRNCCVAATAAAVWLRSISLLAQPHPALYPARRVVRDHGLKLRVHLIPFLCPVWSLMLVGIYLLTQSRGPLALSSSRCPYSKTSTIYSAHLHPRYHSQSCAHADMRMDLPLLHLNHAQKAQWCSYLMACLLAWNGGLCGLGLLCWTSSLAWILAGANGT